MFCQAAQVMALHVQDREIEINLKAVVLSCSPIVTFPFVANSYWYSHVAAAQSGFAKRTAAAAAASRAAPTHTAVMLAFRRWHSRR